MTLTETSFASGFSRDEHGWVLLPRDVEERKELFPQAVFEHPAKANLTLVRELARYICPEGGSVLDPFGGVGSQMVSALDGRKVVLIELEPYFLDLQKQTLDNWDREGREHEKILLYQGDCRQVLPQLDFLVNGAIFSPPYSTTMASTGIKETGADEESGTGRYKTSEYTKSALNISRLNPFFYEQAMGLVLKRLHSRIADGGKICIISKDKMAGPRRIMLSEAAIRTAQRNGFVLSEWLKWKPPSTIAKASATIALRTHGKVVSVVEDEDLIICSKK